MVKPFYDVSFLKVNESKDSSSFVKIGVGFSDKEGRISVVFVTVFQLEIGNGRLMLFPKERDWSLFNFLIE